MSKFTITLLLAVMALFLGAPQAYATNPISPDASEFIVDGSDIEVTKKGNIFQRFIQKTKAKFKAVVAKVKTAYYKVAARSAGTYLALWIVLALVGIGLSALTASGGFGTFLGYAALASYIASAVFFVMWIIALVG